MKKLVFFFLLSAVVLACGNKNETKVTTEGEATVIPAIPLETPANITPVDGALTQEQLENLKPNANIPEGDFPVKKVNFAPEVSKFMVQKGIKTFESKCKSCHTVAGSGGTASAFEGMFSRREPAWVLNMVRNVPMEDIDGTLRDCPTRTDSGKLDFMEGRDLLELFRSLSQ
jgi:hypothetical protein